MIIAIREHGHDYRSLHWDSEKGQQVRFEVLLRLIPTYSPLDITDLASNSPPITLFDIGCGMGDLLTSWHNLQPAMQQRSAYIGIDIVPEFIATAEQFHRHWSNAMFLCENVSTLSPRRIAELVQTAIEKRSTVSNTVPLPQFIDNNFATIADYGFCRYFFDIWRYQNRILSRQECYIFILFLVCVVECLRLATVLFSSRCCAPVFLYADAGLRSIST